MMHDLALANAVGKAGRSKEVIEPDVGGPRRKGVTDFGAVNQAIRVGIAGVEDQPNRFPADRSATQPHERAQAARQLTEVEHIPRCQGVEVSREKMEAVLMSRDAREKIPQLNHPMPF